MKTEESDRERVRPLLLPPLQRTIRWIYGLLEDAMHLQARNLNGGVARRVVLGGPDPNNLILKVPCVGEQQPGLFFVLLLARGDAATELSLGTASCKKHILSRTVSDAPPLPTR